MTSSPLKQCGGFFFPHCKKPHMSSKLCICVLSLSQCGVKAAACEMVGWKCPAQLALELG